MKHHDHFQYAVIDRSNKYTDAALGIALAVAIGVGMAFLLFIHLSK